jgi:protein-disulfide isomerase
MRALAMAAFIGVVALVPGGAVAQAPNPIFVATMGAEDAPVTFIEYASMVCADCAEFHLSVFQKLKRSYLDTGLVRFEFRDLTTSDKEASAAVLARCAGQDRFFEFTRSLLFTQENWVRSSDPLFSLYVLAEMGGMSEYVFTDCLANEELVKSVVTSADAALAEFGIDTAPTFVINNVVYPGLRTFEEFQAILDPLIAAAQAANPAVEEVVPEDPGGFPTLPFVVGMVLIGLVAGTYFIRQSKPVDR